MSSSNHKFGAKMCQTQHQGYSIRGNVKGKINRTAAVQEMLVEKTSPYYGYLDSLIFEVTR